MAADDDDEEGFGDFSFAPSNQTVHSNPKMTNGPDFTTSYNDNDDDDWGDFINSGGLSHALSLPKISKPLVPFGSFTDQNQKNDSEPIQPGSAPSRVNSGIIPWEKPKGALPLSIFGDVEGEEEEESVAGGPSIGDKGANFFSNKETDDDSLKKKGSSGLNMNDLIANLYKHSEPENGLAPDCKRSDLDPHGSKSVDKTNRNEPTLSSRALDLNSNSNSNWYSTNSNGLNVNGTTTNELKSRSQEFNLEWNPLNLVPNGSNSVSKQANLNADGVSTGLVNGNEGFDDDGWEFKGTESKIAVGTTRNEPKLSSQGLSLDWNPLNLDPNGSNSVSKEANLSANGVSTGLVDGNEGFDDDGGWEFKGATSKTAVGDEISEGDQIKTENGSTLNFNGSNSSWDVLSSNVGEMNSNLNGVNLNSLDKNEDLSEEDGWEFKAAESESKARDGNTKGDGKKLENSEGAVYSFGFGNGAHGPGALFGASQWTSHKSDEFDFGFNFNPSALTHDGTISNTYSKSKQSDTENSLYFSQVDGKVDSDEDCWAFKDAFSETGSKDKEGPKVAEVSAAVEAFAFDGEIKENQARLENHKGALPLSIFGDEEEEADDPVIYQDISSQMPTSIPGNSIKSPHLNISDLISSLYSQAEQNTSVNHAQNPNENGFGSCKTLMSLNLANDNDNFDDDSWEFKDASSGTKAEEQASVPGLGESQTKCSTKIELNDYVDFFSKLKEELQFVALFHLDNLKKAQSAGTSEDTNVQALDKEIQDLDNELLQDGMASGEDHSESHSPSKICIDEFFEVLQEPKFQLLNSEYQLSKKLPLVNNDVRSTVELLKHVASTVKILKLVSREEQCSYVSTWSKMLSVCAGELKHGALIWKQSLQKNVHDQILSKPQGKRYILALGEIYKVVEVLGSSVRLYKPWVLETSTDPMGMFTLISECSTLWSSSGLEQALQSISDLTGFAYDGSPKSLLESIKYIHDLDLLTLYNHVFSGQDPICQLSGLTAGTMSGMKTVVWNGEYYFLTLANLWANLMSSDPPNLPHIHVG